MDAKNDMPICPDWVWLNNSNVHVAKDRGWFKTYTPFTSTIRHSIFTSHGHLPVLGVGTVEIPTKRSPNRSGKTSYGSLYLKQVLHVPGFVCNVIGYSIITSDGYSVVTKIDPIKKGTIKDTQGKNMAYFDPKGRLFNVKVRNQPGGPKLGPSPLRKYACYMLSCEWDSSEQQRWLDHRAECSLSTNPSYTDAEKKVFQSYLAS
ncbi:hypothetical protein COCC4DRAFT_35186 [Bipolaris maydis ATCC 48331]|uniref:Retrovirus-related Pol polyprotein from transposon TNT 1-94-like beta-barrel domain-containing protein n=3 Tax=Cochliobolus heterostrophus TaxID=5016 RepID=M2TPK2_COCH5|nr:uncharacterized protein COCC4DRAFT_35186 [Bipolaris maydis ATCC 48331]EMD88489.1 hypothetical protein COCHEDRAFT_1022868 [Bipolaris maydis C5]ENH98632.1 hypothetical protein COCC4DRAFT_35186 [Bipolaris maydis ATCC 48331]